MSRSSRPKSQKRPQQQTQLRLRNEAISHGPYLWSNRDVENALLWFHPPSSSTSDADRENNASDEEDPDEDGDSEGRDFLRRLLQARGIWMRRPLPHRRSQQRCNGKRRKTSSSSSIVGDTGRKSKKKDDDNGRSDDFIGQREKGGRKRSAKVMAGGGGGTLSESKHATQSSPLQSIIMGYYQFFSLSPSKSSNNGNDESDCGENDRYFTASDVQHAELASAKLLEDLSFIISARRHTNELYRAFSNVVNRNDGGNAQVGGGRKMMPGTTPEMSQRTIDEYMTHPTTCVRRVYASSLFDRLLNLCTGIGVDGGFDDNDNSNDNNPALHKFLQKLMGLATENVKIQEVVLLLLLEPMRRLQLQCQKEGHPAKQSQKLSSKLPTTKEENTRQSSQEFRQNRQQQSRGTDPLSPLLTSKLFWIAVSAETTERECSRPPLPTLSQFILQTSPRNKGAIKDDNNLAYSTSFTAAGGKERATQSIVWWTLPSPLLCTISQWYFPMACEYIRYWIDRAMVGHDKLYGSTSTKNHQQQSNYDISIGNINSLGESFQHAILRIKQFCSTSERLHILGSRILHSTEKESQEGLSEMSGLVVREEDENEAFRRALAWKAIHRHVF